MRNLTLLSALLLVGFDAIECVSASVYPKQPMGISQTVVNEISESLSEPIRSDFQVLALMAFGNSTTVPSRLAPIYRVAYRPGRATYVSVIKSYTPNSGLKVLYWETSVTKLVERETGGKFSVTLSMAKCKDKSIAPLYDVNFSQDGHTLDTYVFSDMGAIPITKGGIDDDMLSVVCGVTNEAEAVSDPLKDAAGLFGENRTDT